MHSYLVWSQALPFLCILVSDARVIAIRWEPQEEGMMSTAASFSSVRNQGLIELVGEGSRF